MKYESRSSVCVLCAVFIMLTANQLGLAQGSDTVRDVGAGLKLTGELGDGPEKNTYRMNLIAGKLYEIEMQCAAPDSYFVLANSDGMGLDHATVGGRFTNAHIVFRPAASGVHKIVAASFQKIKKGAFSLIVREMTPQTDVERALAWLASIQDKSGAWNSSPFASVNFGTHTVYPQGVTFHFDGDLLVAKATGADAYAKIYKVKVTGSGPNFIQWKAPLRDTPICAAGQTVKVDVNENRTVVTVRDGHGFAEFDFDTGKILKVGKEARPDGETRSPHETGSSQAYPTSLALLAFLSQGHGSYRGGHHKTVERGAKWLMTHLDEELLAKRRTVGSLLCPTMALAEVHSQTKAKEIQQILARSAASILDSQRDDGGWSHLENSSSTTLTAETVIVLVLANRAGIDVPAEKLKAAVRYLEKSKSSLAISDGQVKVIFQTRALLALALDLAGQQDAELVNLIKKSRDEHLTVRPLTKAEFGSPPASRPSMRDIGVGRLFSSLALRRKGGDGWSEWYAWLKKNTPTQSKDGDWHAWSMSRSEPYGVFPAVVESVAVTAILLSLPDDKLSLSRR